MLRRLRRRLSLFDHPQQRMPARGDLRLGIACGIEARLARQHRLAERLELGVSDAIELHPEIENGNRDELGGFAIATSCQRRAAFLKPCQNRKQLFI